MLAAAAALGIGVAGAHARAGGDAHSIEVLSDRADLISGGDALVAVSIPPGVSPGAVRVLDNGEDVTGAFAVRENGRFEGLVTGLDVGRDVLRARAPGAGPARIIVTDHPNGGPVFSGPQVQPWVCQADAVDDQCNQPPSYAYEYRSSTDGGFHAYDPA